MQYHRHQLLIIIGAGFILLAGLFYIWPASQTSAQCGSQASSCKNCHETQNQDPVNSDGTGWHESHAFGDFCYLCHAGNQQSMEKEASHSGMVPPLSDVKASCQSCHPNDLIEKAQVYAGTLGVEIGTGSAEPPMSDTTTGESESEQIPPAEPAAPSMIIPSSEVIDYSLQYDQTVLGIKTINWGNVILWIMILTIVVGAGGFVYWNERRLRGLPLSFAAKKDIPEAAEIPVVEGYSTEVTSLLPLIVQLNPVGIHSLRRLLQDPDQASDLLHSLSHLDPELIQRLRNLDRDSRALLMALAGQ
jgi:hypothetical protein